MNMERETEMRMRSIGIALLAMLLCVASIEAKTQGLVVCVEPASATELADIYTGAGVLAHGLYRDAAKAQATRDALGAKGLLGVVNASAYDGATLPFIDNTVNAVLVGANGKASDAEVLRVLAPGGTATFAKGGKSLTKAVPSDTDEWPQYLHDPGNNAVAHDDRVGPPQHLQWRAGPRWSRHHDHMSSVSGVISAGGKVFSIMDEGSVASIMLPSDWKLIARDAFNGLRLWDRQIDEWHSRVFALKSGPATLPRRLATDGERVYATLGINDPFSIIDPDTGETIGTLKAEGYAREILLVDDMALVVTADVPMYTEGTKPKTDNAIVAFDKVSGKQLWERKGPVCLLTLGADDKRVYFYDHKAVIALDRANGKDLWESARRPLKSVLSQDAPIVVIHDGVVLFAEPQYGQMEGLIPGQTQPKAKAKTAPKAKTRAKGKAQARKKLIVGIDAATGKTLWEGDQPPSGYRSVGDVLVVDGLVWNGPITSGAMDGIQTGRDPLTGEAKRAWPPTVETYWFHHRCHRAKATDNYLLLSRTGIEYVDVETGNWDINHYVRGACLYGIMPANGLTYAPPHPCSCYPETKLDGFTALSANSSLTNALPAPGANAKERLEKGPAFNAPEGALATPGDWPTFRYSNDRRGYNKVNAGVDIEPNWELDMGTVATQPIAVGDRLYVATPANNGVHAVDARKGTKVWSFTAGGRCDTPPTYHKGRLLFGATDGYVYCLNAADGALAWRFRAAPLDRRQVHFERVESVWPVHGNILVAHGEAVFVAGRSIFLDGGLRFIRLDAMTGELIHESLLDRTDNRTNEPIQNGIQRLNMPVGLPDVLGSDGDRIFMRSEILDSEGKRLGQAPHSTQPIDVILDRPSEDAHLFAPSGFASSDWWHRTYWSYGSVFTGGHDGYYQSGRFTPSGRILAHDDDNVYAFARKQEYYRWISTMDYVLYSAPRVQPVLGPESRRTVNKKGGTNKVGKSFHVKQGWRQEVPIWVRAMAGGGNRLLLAGPPEFLDEKAETDDIKTRLPEVIADPTVQKKIEMQQRSQDGEIGGILIVVDPKNSELLRSAKIPSPPMFDGMITANGSIYMSAMDGHIRRLGGR